MRLLLGDSCMEGVLFAAGAYTDQLITSSMKVHIFIASLLGTEFCWDCLGLLCGVFGIHVQNQVVSFFCLGLM
jgi:hypothetical protein